MTDRWAQWLLERRHGGDEAALARMLDALAPIRDRVLEDASVEPGDTVLDVGCGDGHLRGKAEAGDGVERGAHVHLRAMR